jgi:hypothetical protein
MKVETIYAYVIFVVKPLKFKHIPNHSVSLTRLKIYDDDDDDYDDYDAGNTVTNNNV